jgi:hypothetical protein
MRDELAQAGDDVSGGVVLHPVEFYREHAAHALGCLGEQRVT